jgi:NitT/TauT family transport system substrate-binding protein
LKRAIAAALALLAAAALACAKDTDDPAAKPLTRVRVFAQQHLSSGGFLLAQAAGYFEDEGLEIDWVTAGSGRDLLGPLLDGELDVLTNNMSPIYLNAIAQGGRIRIVADKGHLSRDGCNYLSFITRPELLVDGRLVPRPDGEPWRMSYRRGSFFEFLFDRAVASAGLSRGAIEVHHLTGEVEGQTLVQGGIDVATMTGARLQALLDSNQAAVWMRAQDLIPDAQAFVVLFGPQLLDRDPEAGIRFMTAYLRGVRRYNLGKTARNVEDLAASTGATAEEIERACWVGLREDGRIHVPTLEALVDWAVSTDRLTRRLAVDEIWEPRFVEAAAERMKDAG